MSFSIRALLTDETRRRTAEGWATGKSFVVTGFTMGNGGHDPLDPTTALSPDPSATECITPVFGPKAVSSVTFANDFCPVWECVIDFGEAVTQISNICLIAQIVTSPIPGDPELNSTFLYAVANFPQRPKLDVEQLVIEVGVSR